MKVSAFVYKLVRLGISEHNRVLTCVLWFSLFVRIRSCQCDDLLLLVLRDAMCRLVLRRGSLVCPCIATPESDLCFSNDCSTKMILEEVRSLWYFVHLDDTQTYHDSKQQIGWHGMKKDITRHVSQSLIVSRSKKTIIDRVAYFGRWLYLRESGGISLLTLWQGSHKL